MDGSRHQEIVPIQPAIILGNSSKRFSGVTSTMLQVLEYQKDLANVAVLGNSHLPPDISVISFREMIRQSKKSDLPIVFHARRNDEMIQALIAKTIFGARLKIVFTSTAQRHHSRFTKWLMKRMDSILTTCQAADSYLTERRADKIIPHGVDLARFNVSKDKKADWKKLGFGGTYGIGAFGRIRASKGIDLLVHAGIRLLPSYPDFNVIICGECLDRHRPFQQELERKIQNANLSNRIQFIGKKPFEDLPSLFSALTVVTALSRHEGFGLTPLEAMASGTAVLTSEAGAWPEIIKNGMTGYISKTGDLEDVIKKLEMLIQSPQECLQMGIRGRQLVEEKYTAQREAKEITEHLLSLVDL
jgi:mannosyltransferase